jgi:hypothetical protein
LQKTNAICFSRKVTSGKVEVEGPDGIPIGEADGISPEKFQSHLISLVGILSSSIPMD